MLESPPERGQAEQGVTEQRLLGLLEGGQRRWDPAAVENEGWEWGQARDKVVVGGPEPGRAAVAPALQAEAPTPASLLTRWEVLEPPNFLLFNEPRRRGCPEGVCSLKM